MDTSRLTRTSIGRSGYQCVNFVDHPVFDVQRHAADALFAIVPDIDPGKLFPQPLFQLVEENVRTVLRVVQQAYNLTVERVEAARQSVRSFLPVLRLNRRRSNVRHDLKPLVNTPNKPPRGRR